MQIDILTLFPAMFISPFAESIIKRAVEKALVKINIVDIRDYAVDKHRQVDDYPYGGGAGMVLKPDVVIGAIEKIKNPDSRVVYLSPQGRRLDQSIAEELSRHHHLVLLCGHYEGIDERIMQIVDDEISIGDYVLTGGELPAMVLTDTVIRLIPGVLGDNDSAREESFTDKLLEYPQYTRPAVYLEMEVPAELLSGHHEKIRQWRLKQSLLRTLLKHPELLLEREFTAEEKDLLSEILFNRESDDEKS
ncbi:MAG TPA: tRNA (guanosine(37)-N1)-methyltransferase TrmD [Syntrophomonadaceae bacterium]|nr:tRNA (guanosine(37)-N1)-methyltransferase TrmD [Syntrophomonadaceae bacterium]HNX28557.1 tRNA (guanosine(37)-N1)-methyltransferase TrmD [Syntrophomonadaceae bacterium]HPR92631.1 tRNA (guanosine(37)-N1)-methyltransferase TrmD [Syntrophomonadaceae bacterium]